jgi:hypothetical protein
MKAEFIPTRIPKCHICGADAMPNTEECPDHWNERVGPLLERRWVHLDMPPAPPAIEPVEAKAS